MAKRQHEQSSAQELGRSRHRATGGARTRIRQASFAGVSETGMFPG
ncbi:MAG TPA: hypothetical protein VGB31_09655 [Myxococcota bacterium]